MESGKEEKEDECVAFLDRSTQATRGKLSVLLNASQILLDKYALILIVYIFSLHFDADSMTRLLDDKVEDDEVFWKHDALKEAGDAIFIPEGWYHQVDCDRLTAAVNFWWQSDVISGLVEHMDS